jgi:hypothetical protein
VAVLAYYVVGAGLLFALLCIGVPLAIFARYGGMNVLRSLKDPSVASFTCRKDPATSGHIYAVRPARASRLIVAFPAAAVLFLFLLILLTGVFLILSGGNPEWIAFFSAIFALVYVVFLVLFGLAAMYVLPGARDRRPAEISVSAHGIRSGDIGLPLGRVADLGIGNNGVGISEDPLMPGRHGVSTSAMVGRGLARRQVARSYTLQLRGDGESRTAVLAGGLTEECAGNLERDIRQSIAAFQPAIPA